MALIAKFKVSRIEEQNHPTTGEVTNQTITFDAVTAESRPENKTWSAATPFGTLTMGITNPDAFNQFVSGEEVFLKIEKA